MRYQFVDIGTSFFCTSVDDFGLDVHGLLVEPIKEYLDVVPGSDTVKKANYAIGDTNKEDTISVRLEPKNNLSYISKSQLAVMSNNGTLGDIGVRGCNSFTQYYQHATKIKCNVITFDRLCELYDITEIAVLKIDTEGHETVILPQIYEALKAKKIIITDKIIFEYNNMSNKKELDKTTEKICNEFGFSASFESSGIWDDDMVLTKI